MAEQITDAGMLINQAKQAILAKNAALARNLAEQALALDPNSSDARLILAGLSEPAASARLLQEVLDKDPNNPTAYAAMRWSSTRTREQSAAQWAPAAVAGSTASTAPAPEPAPAAQPLLAARKRPAWAWPVLLTVAALIIFGLYSIGIIPDRPVAGAQFLIKNNNAELVKPSLTPTNTATRNNTANFSPTPT